MMQGFLGKFIAIVALIAIAALMETAQVAEGNPHVLPKELRKIIRENMSPEFAEILKRRWKRLAIAL
ncbi:hypothetical protein MTO96_016254 [Rhipicephalus appendiculatus]